MSNEVTLEQLAGYCDALDVLHRIREERQAVQATLSLRSGTYTVWMQPLTDRSVVHIFARGLLWVSPDRRGTIAQALTYINYNIVMGKFGMDIRDGEVTLEMPVLHLGVEFNCDMVQRCMAYIANILEDHMNTLQRLCWTEETVEEAFGLATVPSLDAMRQAVDEDEASA